MNIEAGVKNAQEHIAYIVKQHEAKTGEPLEPFRTLVGIFKDGVITIEQTETGLSSEVYTNAKDIFHFICGVFEEGE